MDANRILKRLQGALRAGRASSSPKQWKRHRGGRIPKDLATPPARWLYIADDDYDAYERARDQLADDLRFEHLDKRKLEDALWIFACKCVLERRKDHVGWFIDEYARTPREVACYFTVNHLRLERDFQFGGARLLPLGHPDVPGELNTAPPCGSVIGVPTKGTNSRRMVERARGGALHVLRVLRVALREHRLVHDRQLRFELGNWFAFSTGGWGGGYRGPFEMTLTQEMADLVTAQPISRLFSPSNREVDQKALLALEWLDRSRMTDEEMLSTLYCFFALEALLGDRAEGLKARRLAFMQAVLGEVTGDGFTSPWMTEALYEHVRPEAVHGGEVADVERRTISSFQWSARRTMNQFLGFVGQSGKARRSQVLRDLVQNPGAGRVLTWLRKQDASWDDFEPEGPIEP